MSAVTTPDAGGRLGRSLVVVTVATMTTNVASYVMSLVGARLLPAAEFGAFGALLGVSIIASTVALGAQALAARRVAVHLADRGREASTTLAAAGGAGLVLLVLASAASPLLGSLLDVPALVVVVTLASVAASVPGFGALGVAQGGQDHLRFAAGYAALGVLRAVGTVAATLVHPTAGSAVLGMLLGTAAGSALAVHLARAPRRLRRPDRATLRELGRNVWSLLGLFTLMNLDVMVARAQLAPEAAGAYAVGALVAKIAFFLPNAVALVLFPRMAEADGRRARLVAVGATAGVGATVTLGTALLAPVVVAVVAGGGYREVVPVLWVFALQGSVFATAQALLYARMSREARRGASLTWVAVAAFLAAVTLAGTSLVAVVLCSAGAAVALVVALAIVELRPAAARAATEPAADPLS